MSIFLSVVAAAVLTDNIMLSSLLGFEQATDKSPSFTEILKRCGITAAIVFLSSAVSYPVIKWVLPLLGLEVLTGLICVLVICGLIFAAFTLTKLFLPAVYGFLNGYKAVTTCSALVLGICLKLFSSSAVSDYATALLYAVFSMIGFLLVSLVFWSLRGVLNSEELPRSLRGLPVTLLVAALISMAFQGFTGV